jgi:putative transposase
VPTQRRVRCQALWAQSHPLGMGRQWDVTFRLIAISLRQILRLLLFRSRSSRSKDLELLVLRQEVDVLRRQVVRPRFRPEERLVLSVLQFLRPARDRLSWLVTPDTLRRRHRGMVRAKWHYGHRIVSRGRIPEHVQLLVWRLATENPTWGYCRIRGELKKVGAEISTTSIRRILATTRRPPPRRATWRQFMRTAASIIACDLFAVESIRLKTLRVLFFIDLHTRRVLIGGATDGAANAAWCAQIARNLTGARGLRVEPIRHLVHDRDNRFSPVFDEVFRAEGIEIIRTPWRAPKANAYAERFIRTVRAECLNRMLILGPRHLGSVLET